jgi:hypothetical protein
MENQETHWSSTILYSLAGLISSLLIIVDILAIREASLDVLTAFQVQRVANAPEGQGNIEVVETGFAMQAVDQGLLFFGGIVAVAFAIGVEYYFRTGQKKGQFWQRVLRVVGILLAVFIVCVVIQTLV